VLSAEQPGEIQMTRCIQPFELKALTGIRNFSRIYSGLRLFCRTMIDIKTFSRIYSGLSTQDSALFNGIH